MPGTVPVPRSDAMHVGLLGTQIGVEYEHQLFFTKMTGKVFRNSFGEKVAPKKPIVLDNLYDGPTGQDNMIVPVRKNLVGSAYYGDAIISGLGEKQRWDYIKVLINDIQKPLEGPSFMSNQRVKILRLINSMRPDLVTWLAQEDEIQCVSGFYEGWSRNITDTAANFSYAITKRHHPNIFAAGGGPVTWSGTAATHITNIHTLLDPMADTPSSHFSVDNFEALRAYVFGIPLEPIFISGKPFFCVLAHSHQISQLRRDTKFRNEKAQLNVTDKYENELVGSAEIVLSNFLIYERIFSVWGVDVDTSSSALTYGVTNPRTGLDSLDANSQSLLKRKLAIVFGNNAITKGMAGGVRIDTQKQNIGGYEEMAIRQALGYARNTHYDVDASASTPTTAVDQGSALFATFSPQPY